MHLETYPISVNVGRQWKKVDSFSFETITKSSLTFLYLGDSEDSLEYFSTHFQSGIFAEDFIEAQVIIGRFNKNAIPDVIFVDLPLHKGEFQNFIGYLKEKNLLSKTLVIYNDKKLDAPKVRMLKHLELVDDVIDLESLEINYSKKVSFLQKTKSRQNNLHISKEKLQDHSNTKSALIVVKRALDIMFSLTAIVVLSPILLLIALIVKLESKGPIIYISRRAGKGFKIFNFYKFRTMELNADQKIDALVHLNQYENSDGNGAKFLKLCNDPRVTRFGKILRKTSLDELPQLFNVLKGDMSLVGNRPLPLYEASTLTTNEFVERFMAPAGITGLWQIKKNGGKTQISVEERINLDIAYARKGNFFYDLWIMAQTPAALLQKNNR